MAAVAILTINRDGLDDRGKSLASLRDLEFADHQVYVVDNGSRDGDAFYFGRANLRDWSKASYFVAQLVLRAPLNLLLRSRPAERLRLRPAGRNPRPVSGYAR